MHTRLVFVFIPFFLVGCSPKKEVKNEPKKYERVVIFGVDGAGCAFKDCETPNFDRIFYNGNVNYNGIAESPTISAQNWGAMIYGVDCQTHQKTNDYIANNKHNDDALPSFMKTYSKNHPNSTYYSAVNWTPTNYGLFEDMPELIKNNLSELGLSSSATDDKVAESVITRLNESFDAITFMQFDSVDGAGHASGNSSESYFNAIKHIDVLLGNIYDAYVAKGIANTTLFICVSDHGHTLTGGHGGDSESEKAVTIAVNGGLNNIVKGSCEGYYTYDLASVVLHALGEESPSHYKGKVPNNLFKENY